MSDKKIDTGKSEPIHHGHVSQSTSHLVHSHNEISLTEKIRKNPWILSTFIFGVIILILMFNTFSGGTSKSISETEASKIILDLAKSQVPGETKVVNVSTKSGLYEVILNIDGRDLPVYLTKDGENLIGGLTPVSLLNQQTPTDPKTQEQPTEIPKSIKPKVELFVMTHCPYGTQSEKGIIPAIKSLGSNVDFKLRFVHYFMHGDKEEQETYRQLCIRETQSAKFIPYLECFLNSSGNPEDSSSCMKKLSINEDSINSCATTKGKEYYAKDSELSNSYGVQGSPTLVINGVQSNAGRDSSSYLTGICSAFTKVPFKCSTEKLSTSAPSPGFGYSAASSGSNTVAQCN